MAGRTLVAYHTKTGASGTYAKTITETLASLGLQVDLVDLKENIPEVAGYDAVIVGTGVRIGWVYRRWRKLLKQKALGDRKLFLFLSSGTAVKEPALAVEKYLRKIVEKLGLKPVSMISLPGFFPEKWAKTEEDRHTVKPELAAAWAREIAERLKK